MRTQREIEEVTEIKKPQQPKENCAAAFFDLDGTVAQGPSLEKGFLRLLRYRREIGVRNYLRWAAEAVRLMPRGFQQIVRANKMYLSRVQGFDERDWGNGSASPWHKDGHQAGRQAFTPLRRNPRVPVPSFSEEAVDRVAWHATQRHTIVLVSGTLEPLAQGAAYALEAELAQRGVTAEFEVCATRLEEIDGRWTGRIVGEAMCGGAKARAIRRIADELDLDLEQCYAYGNSRNDEEMLAVVGRPMAVNPSIGLARTAGKKKWPVLQWGEKKI
jgi:HAD superfamily phosphoserine phosphatase-like hydrolase